MTKACLYTLLITMAIHSSCNNNKQKQHDENNNSISYKEGSFGYDLTFLKQHDSVVILKGDDENSQVLVSSKYQAKVFTSTADGNEGLSFGWVN